MFDIFINCNLVKMELMADPTSGPWVYLYRRLDEKGLLQSAYLQYLKSFVELFELHRSLMTAIVPEMACVPPSTCYFLSGQLQVVVAHSGNCCSAQSVFTLYYQMLSAEFSRLNGTMQSAVGPKWPIVACPCVCASAQLTFHHKSIYYTVALF